MRVYIKIVVLAVLLVASTGVYAQVTCSSTTPVYTIDMTGNPDSSWTSPSVSRMGQCCGASSSDRCIRFDITLDANAQGVTVTVTGGTGTTDYTINCGTSKPVGDTICLSGSASYTITICKPGSNVQTYTVTSVAKPMLSQSTVLTSPSCSKNLTVSGLQESSIIWKSLGNNTTYNGYLGCQSGCDTTSITIPASGFPSYVDYVVSGYNKNFSCDTTRFYDTVRVYMYSNPSVSISPKPIQLCYGISSTSATASVSGGLSPYQLLWSTSDTSSVVTLPIGTHWVRVTDSLGCIMNYDTVVVSNLPQILAHAGNDTSICSAANSVYLNGSVSNATGGRWTGRGGNFIGDSATLKPIYIPSYAEVQAGSTYLVLTTTGNGSCSAAKDTLFITIYNAPKPVISGDIKICAGTQNVAYSVSPSIGHTYDWHVVGGTIASGQGTSQVNVNWGKAGPGYIYMIQADSNGCQGVGAINTISRFDFNSRPLTKATIGPDATSSDADAYPDGFGYRITSNCGGSKGIDLTVPGSVFNRGKICMTYSWQRDESYADFFTRGGVTFKINGGNLELSLRVSDGLGGYTNVGPLNTGYSVPYDDVHRYFTFCYDSATGVGVAMQFDSVVWTYNGTPGRSLYWTGAGDATIGTIMDGSCSGRTLLDWSNISVPITITALPKAAIVGPNNVCQYKTASYVVNDTVGYYTYQWLANGATILSGQSTDSIYVQWDSLGTRTLSVLLTDTINGCDSTLYIDVSVNPQPVPSIAGADSICQSIESAFIAPANANYTYQWTASTGLFTGVATDDTATISFAQGGSHTISLKITNAITGCDSSITKTIFVDSLPISIISGNNPVCEGSIGNVYQAVSNSLYSYTWVPTLGTITAGAGTNAVTIDWPTAGSGNLQLSIVKAPLGCINKIQYPVTITAKPVTGAVQYR